MELAIKSKEEFLQKFDEFVEASKVYYGNDDEPIMSDEEFDELKIDLLDYISMNSADDELSQYLTKIESTIYNDENGLQQVTEDTLMISLKKIKFLNQKQIIGAITEFFHSAIKSGKTLYWAPKLDGIAIGTKQKMLVSRGGIDITNKFGNVSDIKNSLSKYSQFCGELLINKKLFENNYADEYENARNFVGKLVKEDLVDTSIIDNLSFMPTIDGKNPLLSYKDKYFSWEVVTNTFLANIENIFYSKFKNDDFPYLCDGIVIGFIEDGPRQIKGNYPLNLVSIKFPSEEVETTVIDMYYVQKKTGTLIPKLMIKPTMIMGCTAEEVNGYNYGLLKSKGVGIGSTITIVKSGDIIPVLKKCLTKSSNFKMPDVKYRIEGKHLMAENLEISRKYKFELAVKHLKLQDVGPALITELGEICDYNIIELFNPKYKTQIINKLGSSSAKWQRFKEFYNISNLYLDDFIFMLQFNKVGIEISRKIALLITKKSTDSSNIPQVVKDTILKGEGFAEIKNKLNIISSYGIRILPPIDYNNTDVVTFEMTGDPIVDGKPISKGEFEKLFKQIVPNAVHTGSNKKLMVMFTDNMQSNTTKMNFARKNNIQILLYSDFRNFKIRK